MASDKELEEKAFEIFAQTPLHMRGDKVALDSFRKAQDFINVRNALSKGELDVKKPEGPQLADCCAPNLPRNHPHNLVAALYTERKTGAEHCGDIQKVGRIKAWLDKNPMPETDPEQLVPRLAAAFPELSWDVPTINTARAIFPAYCVN